MRYGLIGEKLSHSFSPQIHGLLGNGDYVLREIPKGELEEFFKKRDFCAVNVTIPYKEAVIPFLDEIDPAAARIGAVNTVVNRDGVLTGYNTDHYGLMSLIKRSGIDPLGKTAVILGTGGTSKTAQAVLSDMGARVVLKASRSPRGDGVISYEELLERADEFEIVVNTTPVGMFPSLEGSAVDISAFRNLCGVIDVIYNPLSTDIVLDAAERGIPAANGLYMLVCQAAKAAALFFDDSSFLEKADGVFDKLSRRMRNTVLIGMPGSGKSTVGKLLADLTGREFFDCDEEFKKRYRDISEFFALEGEAAFRKKETLVCRELSQKTGCVIATGGGVVTEWENVRMLKKNGTVVLLDRDIDLIVPTADRPLSSDRESLEKRYRERGPLYKAAADVTACKNASAETVAFDVAERLSLFENSVMAEITPSAPVGCVTVPASKSVAHRHLINAALTEGETVIENVPDNGDIAATVDCLRCAGATVIREGNSCRVKGGITPKDRVIDCGESGSTLRFLFPVLLDGKRTVFRASGRLPSRPMGPFEDICSEQGLFFEKREDGFVSGGRLHGGTFEFPGNVSSQFVTGLLMALPTLSEDSRIFLTTEAESVSYVDLTVASLKNFGITVKKISDREYLIPGGQRRKSPGRIRVEGDESGAAFFGGLNALGGEVDILGLDPDTVQGDRVWRDLFGALDRKETVSVRDCPDLAPILLSVSALKGGCRLTDTARLSFKESDRAAAMKEELEKCGVKVTVEENSVTVTGTAHSPCEPLSGHGDHRIVMALAVLLSKLGGTVTDAQAVSKSMPEFWQIMDSLGVKTGFSSNERQA